MMSFVRATAYFGRIAGIVLLAGGIAAQAAPAKSTAHVYVLSGLLSLSPGLDDLAEKIRHAGVPATVHNHTLWSTLATEVTAQYKRGELRSIAIIGHSLGGGAALDMAAELGQAGVPVDILVAVDSVGTSEVPPNVRRTVNFYVEGGLGSPMQGAPGAHGTIQNVVDSSEATTHWTIMAAHERELIRYVLTATRSGARAAQAQNTPTASR